METFNLLFESLSKCDNTEIMIFKLYERLLYYNLNPSYSIISIVMKLVDKKSKTSQNNFHVNTILKTLGKVFIIN